jgi:hypothetical protein
MIDLLGFLLPVVWAMVGSSAVYGVREVLLGLAAKTRAQNMLRSKAHDDAELRLLVDRIATLKSEPTEELRLAITSALAELPKQDQKFVEQGINQSSKLGASRYIRDLASAT